MASMNQNISSNWTGCFQKWMVENPRDFLSQLDRKVEAIASGKLQAAGRAVLSGASAGLAGLGFGSLVASVAFVRCAIGPVAGAIAAVGAAALAIAPIAEPEVGAVKAAANWALIAGGGAFLAEIVGVQSAEPRFLTGLQIGEKGTMIPLLLLSAAMQIGVKNLLNQRIRLALIKHIQFGIQFGGGTAILVNLSQASPLTILTFTPVAACCASALASFIQSYMHNRPHNLANGRG